ncbi:hypothetical protein B0J12DRAFT_751027 [Macrophomina phaseolina]|uniref:Uncharacterized protein n=1 Tax=Macrophomina phaseolina TaxID=35725 RepID=A0ABQ8GES7_9PEZI|nr:hypothetical protein B0J12DRAFT_751027 [Macrophomina phaseolina]
MTVPDSCRIAFSLTALCLTGCTIAFASIRKHGRASRVGHGIVTLITAGFAAISICHLQFHGPFIDRATVILLCAAIGASPFVKVPPRSLLHDTSAEFAQFETLKEALGPSGVLQPYLSICTKFARTLIALKSVVVVMLMTDNNIQTFTSILFLSVALEYGLLGVITFYLQKLAVQQNEFAFKRVAQQLLSWSGL